jgi:hypothetical protein
MKQSSVEITEEQIEILKECGVKPYEISHLKNGTTNKIGKERMKSINRILNAKILDAENWVPFKGDKIINGKILIEPVTFERY